MLFFNSAEISDLAEWHGARRDNLGRAVRVLNAVCHDADSNSDGWATWPRPARACRQLMELIRKHAPMHGSATSPTDAELRKALAPIRAFYTKLQMPEEWGSSYPQFPDGDFPEEIRAITRRLLRSARP